MAAPLVSAPKRVRRGDVFEVKTLISHPMETGFRPGTNGTIIPRDIVQKMRCRFAGEAVFDLELSPAISANPYFIFYVRAETGGALEIEWTGDNGFSASYSALILVE
ncbi:MAG: thiosulfate oxidation carrier complex protein SoxZ [Alphaproteobacteria bacterium]|nr:thiosulfate oxidation carrier complex protein SoxZ [Alphaproteobacteria bacterium]